jgi:RNA-directed DNA polymerase
MQVGQLCKQEDLVGMTKPYQISKQLVWDAYRKVKINGGAAGVDQESIQAFETKLKANLYKQWNRMSSGSYFPPPVRGVDIPKKSGGMRTLGVPTVADRVAQSIVKMVLEPILEPVFHQDSYGYRPGRSAHDAVDVVRKRNWQYDWVVEFDIKGLFDNIDHELLMRALRKHCQIPWILLYVERWLKAPLQTPEGELVERRKGTPQGGVISPLLANLFLHYAFDRWVSEKLSEVPFCRYSDDGVLHCKNKAQAELVKCKIGERFLECGLELHPEKTQIVYCRDSRRKGDYPVIQYTFLGFTFCPRQAVSKAGITFTGYLPGVSRNALRHMRQTIRRWNVHLKNNLELANLSGMLNPILKGWMTYYTRFYGSAMAPIWNHVNHYLVRWMMRKYKTLCRHKTRASKKLQLLAQEMPQAFVHWKAGYCTSMVG